MSTFAPQTEKIITININKDEKNIPAPQPQKGQQAWLP